MASKKKTALTEVKDFNGTPVYVGDTVVYIHKSGASATRMEFGTVVGFSKVWGTECAVIKDCYGLIAKPTSQSIYKVG